MQIAQTESGKWFIVIDDPNCVSTVGRKSLSQLRDDEYIDCNTNANACLVAAAPELFEALEMLLRWEETGAPISDVCFSKARAAITKAKSGGI